MSYVSFSGQQLVEMHHNGDTNALSELMRRHAKNERASTAKLIEQCGVAVAPATQPTPTETSPMMNQQQILQCIQSGDPQQMQLLLALLASQAPATAAAAPAPAPKPKPTISRNSRKKNDPPAAAGANICTVYEADGSVTMLIPYRTERVAGTSEYAEHAFEGDQAYLNGYEVNAPTLKEAREQFYAGLKHYLPRAYRKTIDERGAKTEAQFTPVAKPAPITEVKTVKTLHGSADIMSRDQLKAALGYDRSSKVATKTMRAEFAALQGNATPPAVPTPAPKPAPKPAVHIPQPQTQDIEQLIADLMARKNG